MYSGTCISSPPSMSLGLPEANNVGSELPCNHRPDSFESSSPLQETPPAPLCRQLQLAGLLPCNPLTLLQFTCDSI